MKKFTKVLALLICISLSTLPLAVAVNDTSVTQTEKNAVKRAMDKLSKDLGKKLPLTEIARSPVPGILQVTSDLNVFYVTTDGQYFFVGELLNPSLDKNSWSITETEVRKLRVSALNDLKPQDMIIFPASGTKIGFITVFTDIDCPYCRKMQADIKDYTNAGIEVRYLAFPRSGPKTQSFDEAVKVWCAKDKTKAYNEAVEMKIYPKESCSKNPVTMEFELGQKMSINGTPTIILDNGVKLGGLVDAQSLVKIMQDSK